MKREILISGTPRETRVAILEDDRLVELLVDRPDHRRTVGDIYLGRVEAVLGGIWELTGRHASELHLIYGLVPIAVSFVAEQLRVSTAQMVLDKEGFESAQAVGELPDEEQQAMVVAILRRELGVMALAALVNTALLARAAMTH